MKNKLSMTTIKKASKTLQAIVLLLVTASSLYSQQNNTLYFMKNTPQSRYLNPAKSFRCNVYLGMPGASSVYYQFSNTMFNLEDLIFPGTGAYADSLITILHPSYDLDDFLGKLGSRNLLNNDLDLSILSMGFRSGKSYVSFDIMQRVSTYVSLPRDLLTIALKGNGDFIGETADFSKLGIQLLAYNELGVGISKQVSKNLNIGYRPKILFGQASITTQSPAPDIGLYTDATTFDLRFHSTLSLNVSAPLDIQKDTDGKIEEVEFREIEPADIPGTLFNFKNMGFGLDLGMEYRLMEKLVVSASLTDLGYIRWGMNTYNFKQDGEFTFTGFDLSEGLVANASFDLEQEAEILLDSIAGMFDITSVEEGFTTFLAPKLYLAGELQLSPGFSLGLLSRSELFGGKIRQSLTLSANSMLAKFLNLSLSYTMMNHAYDNLGAGFGIKGGPFHFYFVTDRIPVYFTKISATTSDFSDLDGYYLPNNFNSLNFRFGFNLIFGCKRKHFNDRPMII